MISISARPENSPRRVAGDVALYNEYLSRLTFNCVRHEAALCAIGFLRFTPPFKIRTDSSEKGKSGLGKDDEAVGNEAVELDIRRIFRPTDSNLAGAVDETYGSMDAFMRWKRQRIPNGSNSIMAAIWKDADVERAYAKARNLFKTRDRSRLLDNAGQMRAIHDAQLRAYRGRIRRHRGPTDDIRKNPYLVEARVLNKYIELRQKQVGWLKAAWAKVVRSIGKVELNGKMVTPGGGSYLARWITRHGAGGGGHVAQDFARKRIKIVNSVGDNDGVSSTADVTEHVVAWRNLNLNALNPYQKEIDKSVRLWNAGRIKARNARIYGN